MRPSFLNKNPLRHSLIPYIFIFVMFLITSFNSLSQSASNTQVLTSILGKWYNLSMRNDYLNGGYENGSTGDYEPIKINEDGTWSYYGKKRNLTIIPFTESDVKTWQMKSNYPKWKLIFQDFSNGEGIGYISEDGKGQPLYLVVKFKIYSPKEGTSTWIQYRKS